MSDPSPPEQPDQPDRKAPAPRSHWYNSAVSLDDAPRLSAPYVRRGNTRERVKRRHEDRTPVVDNAIDDAPSTQESQERVNPRRGGRIPLKVEWTWAVVAAVVVGVIGLTALLMLSAIHGAAGTQTNLSGTANPGQDTQLSVVQAPTFASTIQPWDAKQRFTMLIMGIDKRPGETGTGFRTDTLILVSVDPVSRKIGMLSIPRDLFMPLPGRKGLQRINTAYLTGELERPGGGPTLAVNTLQYNLGIHINKYVVVSFDAVINLVDAIDGIDIDVAAPIDDPEYPDMYNGYDPLYIPAGHIHMDGQLALKYARTRHQDDDYRRTRRQQQVLLAIRQKMLNAKMIPQLIGKAPTIWNEVSRGVITDLKFDEILSMAWYLKDVPIDNIERGTLDGKYTQVTVQDGENVIVVNRTTIQGLMTQVFGPDYNH